MNHCFRFSNQSSYLQHTMRRLTRRSIVGLDTDENQDKIQSFSTKFPLPSFVKQVEKLTNEQREAIKSVGFGNLLEMPNQMFNKTLLVELMERWSSDKRVIMLSLGELTISVIDVALILGIQVISRLVILEKDEPVSELELGYGATFANRKITVGSLEARLDSNGGNAYEDFVRTFLLFCFGTFLFPHTTGKVDSHYLFLLENLDEVHCFAWGAAALDDIFTWLNKRKETNFQYIGGNLIFLQVVVVSESDVDIGKGQSSGRQRAVPERSSVFQMWRSWASNIQ